ncbi:nucleoside phosphatase family-domain-containing protein [Cantharellus anzutake]|uniref:nucleoside phosphatase family-domain-containing protein n=1 Tax=Cantharellus anzutake TaxID=1750568 RepID=UPI0019080B19|nr:nucleoside phosphatase family-domain-containing protein [Cantharellus anzutake]KAF8333433.1 nucleoside phosphatase family-domain-containing protein [Cantharellus anzutake]
MRSGLKNLLSSVGGPPYSPLGRADKRRQLPWKIAIIMGAILFFLWVIPTRYVPLPTIETPAITGPTPIAESDIDDQKPPFPHDSNPPARPDTKPPTPPPAPPKAPTSFETDKNPASTVYCATPYSKDKKLVQYALMIDAGSQGSRIHVYKFNNCQAQSKLEYEVFKELRPGLSAYASDPVAAAQSLDPLLEEAVKIVPHDVVSCTPVAVKATAGLRLLGADVSAEILRLVRSRIRTKYNFEMTSDDRVAIMDGKDEGVFAWITSNYLLNTIGPHVSKGNPSYAVLDLGGASTQIVLEPTFGPESKETFKDGDHKYELVFAGKTHVLYQHSYLGYGLMRARRSIHNLVAFMNEFGQAQPLSPHQPSQELVMGNPCLSKGMTRVVEIDGVGWRKDVNITMKGGDIGSYTSCNRLVELVMAKDAICEVKPCSFNGAYQPSITDTFPSGGILTLSYFSDRIIPLIRTKHSKGRDTIKIKEIATLAERVCNGAASWKKYWGDDQEAMKELEGRPEACLDLTFMHALLRLGYEFSDNREATLVKKIDGIELGWALGAGIALISGELSCKA